MPRAESRYAYARSNSAEALARARARAQRVHTIMLYARSKGIDANTAMVSANLALFERWYAGYLAVGVLMNETGVGYIP